MPKNITATQVVTVESKINVPANGTLSDVNITKVQGNHEFFKDLEMHLIGPSGADVLLFKDKCPNYNGNFNFGFDDSKASIFNCPPPNNGNTYRPTQSLSAFNGQNASGQWTLRVKDNTISSGGKITAFVLELCSSTTLNPPVLVNNNTLQVQPGTNQAIITALLKTEDANNTADQLVYTLMTKPAWGRLERNWGGEMQVGDQFTQTDLDNGAIRYFDYGAHTGTDNFCFTVTDGEGGLVKGCFTIQPFPVGTAEAKQAIDFVLSPNPATDAVRLAFSAPLRSETRVRLFDSAGRLLRQSVLAEGQWTLEVPVRGLPQGIYTISVENTEGSGVRRVVVR